MDAPASPGVAVPHPRLLRRPQHQREQSFAVRCQMGGKPGGKEGRSGDTTRRIEPACGRCNREALPIHLRSVIQVVNDNHHAHDAGKAER